MIFETYRPFVTALDKGQKLANWWANWWANCQRIVRRYKFESTLRTFYAGHLPFSSLKSTHDD
jgi:hypothetical protein